MQSEPTRPINLLRNAGIAINRDTGVVPSLIPEAIHAWAFSMLDGRLGLWIYEFRGQRDLDTGISQVDKQLMAHGQALDFAQNGEFLLVVVPMSKNSESAEDRQRVMRIVQAFSGEVER